MADAFLEGHYTGTAFAEQTPLHNELADSNVAWQVVGARAVRKSLGCHLPLQTPLAIANSIGNVSRKVHKFSVHHSGQQLATWVHTQGIEKSCQNTRRCAFLGSSLFAP